MKLIQTKKFIILLILALITFLPFSGRGTDYSSPSFKIKDSVIDIGQSSLSSTNFGLGQSLGQTAIGKSTSTSFQLWSGFQYFFKVKSNTLTATAGDGQVSLSWTAPQTFLGVSVGGYELGTGIVSGSYTFEDVGNVISYTKTGLSNGTTYYFKVKAKTAGGTFLVFSNEATTTPTGGEALAAGVVGSGGGGIPVPGATLKIKGLSSPGAAVTVLKDGSITATAVADNEALFNFTLTGLSGGIHNFSVYAVDQEGTKSTTYTFSQNLNTGVAVTVDDVFLAPTIHISHIVIKKGEDLIISGFTAPAAEVSIFIDSQPLEKVFSSAKGAWRISQETKKMSLGLHTVKAQASKNRQVSESSELKEFTVSEEKSVPVLVEERRRSDLNSDGRVDLVDFSILLFYWEQPVSGNIAADIDKSGVVDLIDFSIMLYDWTG